MYIAEFFVKVASAQQTKLITGIGGNADGTVTGLGQYILNIYKWGIGLAALSALAFLVFGAIQKILSAGNIASAESANERISVAIYGLILLLAAVTILYSINSRITDISDINTNKILQDIQKKNELDSKIAAEQRKIDDLRVELAKNSIQVATADYAAQFETTKDDIKKISDSIVSKLGANPSNEQIKEAYNSIEALRRQIGWSSAYNAQLEANLKSLGFGDVELNEYFNTKFTPDGKQPYPIIQNGYGTMSSDYSYQLLLGDEIFRATLLDVQKRTNPEIFEKIALANPALNANEYQLFLNTAKLRAEIEAAEKVRASLTEERNKL
jgi:hypothetical protein